jgi:hypothetical protein
MEKSDGRVTLLPAQRRRLAELDADGAIAIIQQGSVLHIHAIDFKLTIDADGRDIHPENQEPLC